MHEKKSLAGESCYEARKEAAQKQEAAREAFEDGLKREINEALFKRLPHDTTLEEMDKIACELWDKICKLYETTRPAGH